MKLVTLPRPPAPRPPAAIPERERWEAYEREKERLMAENLPHAEYERRIREVLDRLEL